jgi:outer membrane receptor protein involved in Fe transport
VRRALPSAVRRALLLTWCPAALLVAGAPAMARAAGALEGRITTGDTREALAYAAVSVLPADTSQPRTGGLTQADGTFRIPVPPGAYRIVVQAISYRTFESSLLEVAEGASVRVEVVLEPDAIQQEEIVVEGQAAKDTEAGLLTERRKAGVVQDAISAQEIRRTPDIDAGEVLRRVTGVTLQDGRYVFVRGMGERYSSAEVDGVRLASAEENKRVVGMDLLPAPFLDNVVIQKTYSVDRPGEFGGGDVQVRTLSIPEREVFTLGLLAGLTGGTSFQGVSGYDGYGTDLVTFGGSFRDFPEYVQQFAGNEPLVPEGLGSTLGFPIDSLALFGSSFRNVWSTASRKASPNGGIKQSYGNSFPLFGRRLGVVESFLWGRSERYREGADRFYVSQNDTIYDLATTRSSVSARLGGLAALSYELSHNHLLRARGVYSLDADDEVLTYEGHHDDSDGQTRGTRLLYLERSALTLGLDGRHRLAGLGALEAEWRASYSEGSRQQPDRAETAYDLKEAVDDDDQVITYWGMSRRQNPISREFGDQTESGWGADASLRLPFRPEDASAGSASLGLSYLTKDRESSYRRFRFEPASGADDSQPAESLFTDDQWTGTVSGAEIREITRDDDSYTADQTVAGAFANLDWLFARRWRLLAGLRVERGQQNIVSRYQFDPTRITAEAEIDETDLLPALNLVWNFSGSNNLRLAASRTLSRPDLRELSSSPNAGFSGGYQVAGNPNLVPAHIANCDLRWENFPGVGEVLALGGFFKYLDQPIENVLTGADSRLLTPKNSESGWVAGGELEARFALSRLWSELRGLRLQGNLSLVESEVTLKQETTVLGTEVHPLQGQADYAANLGLEYASPRGSLEGSILFRSVGRRLETLGIAPQPDIYREPESYLDIVVNWYATRGMRLKAGVANLLGTDERTLQGANEATYEVGRMTLQLGLEYRL